MRSQNLQVVDESLVPVRKSRLI